MGIVKSKKKIAQCAGTEKISPDMTDDRQIARTRRSAFRACLWRLPAYALRHGPAGAWRYIRDAIIIIRSNLFDYSFYLWQNPDVARSGTHPLVHYLEHGAFEGRNPNPLFDVSFYLEKDPEAAVSRMDPFAHFVEYGADRGYSPHLLFNTRYYLASYPDVARAQTRVNPLEHYLCYGSEEGRNPHPLFDTLFYRETNPDVARARANPLVHYVCWGAAEGRDPHPLFDTSFYLEANPDVAEAKANPLAHYILNGASEGRHPHSRYEGIYDDLRTIRDELHRRWDSAPSVSDNSNRPPPWRSIRHARLVLKAFFRNPVKSRPNYFQGRTGPLDEYGVWIAENEQYDPATVQSEIDNFRLSPEILLLLPVYGAGPKWLDECVKSVLDQYYGNWALRIYVDGAADGPVSDDLAGWEGLDSRIKLETVQRDLSDHLREALENSTASFVCLLDQDYILAPFALYEIAGVINGSPSARFIYSDEDLIDEAGKRSEPFFKPDWSPDLLLSFPYTSLLSVFEKEAVIKAGGFAKDLGHSGDYDLLLRVSENVSENAIAHVPKVLCHKRSLPGLNGMRPAAEAGKIIERSREALRAALRRRGLGGEVMDGVWPGSFRVRRELLERPLVSIIIPTRDKVGYLRRCVSSIVEKTTYPNYEIVVVDNDSSEPETLDYFRIAPIRVCKFSEAFNFARINNFAVRRAEGKYVIFLNNDTEVITPDWIEAMLELAQDERVGAVGCKLLFPFERVQHAGVVLGYHGVAGHIFRYLALDQSGYFGLADVIRNYSAVTAAAMMVRRSVFDEISGFDERFPICFNDVDLCLRIGESGYSIVYTPFARLYHYESVSRGSCNPHEAELMTRRWCDIIENDPFYSPNLSLSYSYRIRTDV